MSSAGTTTVTELHNNANEAVIPLDSSVALGTNVHDQATVSDDESRPRSDRGRDVHVLHEQHL